MLITNYSYINQICGHVHSGITNPKWCLSPHAMRNYYNSRDNANLTHLHRDNFPVGTQPPYCYMMADTGINITTTTTINGITDITYSNLAGGLSGESNLSGSGIISLADLNATASVISALSGLGTVTTDITGKLEAASTLLGQGDITAALGALSGALADLTGTGTLSATGQTVVSIFSDLSGNGTLTFTSDIIGILEGVVNLAGTSSQVADIVGAWYMSSGLTGTSTLAASLESIANLVSALTSSGVLNASSNAYAGMSANIQIGVNDPLSPENLAASLWNSLASLYNNPGTMGEKLNSAGGAADPWGTILPGSYTGTEAGKVLSDIQTLIKQVKALTAANL
jgi:hypothetical protein